MEYRHLRYFVAVARERNFSRAANALNIAQPPLSRQIRQFEAELGVDLFDRAVRPLRLTEAGRLVLDQAVQIVERFDELRALAGRMRAARQDVLRIGLVASTLYGRLPDVIRSYRARRPSVELSLVELFSIEQVAALKEGRIDIGFGRIPLDDPAVERRLLQDEPLVVALPAEHRLARSDVALTLADVAAGDVIIYPRTPRPSYADQVLAAFRSRGLRPAGLQEVRELQTALGLVAAGVGACLVPAAVERLRRDNVVYRPLAEKGLGSPIFMSMRAGEPSTEVAHLSRLAEAVYSE